MSVSGRPIRPEEVTPKVSSIPREVFDVINDMISEKVRRGRAVLKQDDIVARLVEDHTMNSEEIFEKGWLDIEGLYEQSGWRVIYDRPAYNESYPATFTFEAR